MENSLSVENIHFSYNKKTVLNDISFKCDNGVIALLGNNGAGKTTLMNILTGLKRPLNGKVLLNGNDILQAKPYPVEHVGYLPQHFDVYKNVTGYDFLSYVYDVKKLDSRSKEKKRVIDEIVEKYDLTSVINKRIGKYSGGFKRRLGIAQAVIGKPSLIIIDEPTVGLDPEQRIEFRKHLSELSDHAITIISTHIIEDVEIYSNRLLILKDHTIKFNGTIKDILHEGASNISTIDVHVADLLDFKRGLSIIEEKRIDENTVRVRFINKGTKIAGSYQDKEISLENAYVYFQKK